MVEKEKGGGECPGSPKRNSLELGVPCPPLGVLCSVAGKRDHDVATP